MSNIFELEQEYLEILNELEASEGVLSDELAERMKINKDNFNSKVIGYGKIIRETQGKIAIAEAEIERIQKSITTRKNLVERLKKILLDALIVFGDTDKKTGVKRYDAGLFKLNTRKSEALLITDETLIPDEYKTFILSSLSKEQLLKIFRNMHIEDSQKKSVIKNKELKEDIESGKEIAGATIDKRVGIQIK